MTYERIKHWLTLQQQIHGNKISIVVETSIPSEECIRGLSHSDGLIKAFRNEMLFGGTKLSTITQIRLIRQRQTLSGYACI
jgi:hypothetical protein